MCPVERVVNVQVIGPENAPENRTPSATPFALFPSTIKLPPSANVPPICTEPLVKAPVEKDTVPRFPITGVPEDVATASRDDAVNDSPAFDPDRTPPMLPKSVLLSAKAAWGRVRQPKRKGTMNRSVRGYMPCSMPVG